jgi:hypothetical protein
MTVHRHDPAGKTAGSKVTEDFGADRSTAPASPDNGDRLRLEEPS